MQTHIKTTSCQQPRLFYDCFSTWRIAPGVKSEFGDNRPDQKKQKTKKKQSHPSPSKKKKKKKTPAAPPPFSRLAPHLKKKKHKKKKTPPLPQKKKKKKKENSSSLSPLFSPGSPPHCLRLHNTYLPNAPNPLISAAPRCLRVEWRVFLCQGSIRDYQQERTVWLTACYSLYSCDRFVLHHLLPLLPPPVKPPTGGGGESRTCFLKEKNNKHEQRVIGQLEKQDEGNLTQRGLILLGISFLGFVIRTIINRFSLSHGCIIVSFTNSRWC